MRLPASTGHSLAARPVVNTIVLLILNRTNWGNLGHPGGYTSYDYGAAIAEDRTVARAKYSEIKLQAHFLRASPAYLTATPEPAGNGSYVSTPEIATSRLASGRTQFFVVRHAAYNSNASTSYRLEVPTSRGNLSLPRSGNLTLNGRDSKIHVVDYDVGGINVLYSTAEVFTWYEHWKNRDRNADRRDRTNDSGGKLLILYGGPNESHEASFEVSGSASIVEGSGVQVFAEQDSVTLNWAVESEPRIVDFSCGLRVLLLSKTLSIVFCRKSNSCRPRGCVQLLGPRSPCNRTRIQLHDRGRHFCHCPRRISPANRGPA